jgi:hypothetical protein
MWYIKQERIKTELKANNLNTFPGGESVRKGHHVFAEN